MSGAKGKSGGRRLNSGAKKRIYNIDCRLPTTVTINGSKLFVKKIEVENNLLKFHLEKDLVLCIDQTILKKI